MNLDSSSDSKVSLRTRFRHATREAILDAAAGILSRESAAQARMEDIAARAGVAVGTVYNYFDDRRALVTALLETRTQTLLEALDGAVGAQARTQPSSAATRLNPAESFEAALARFVAAMAAHVEANRFLLNMLFAEEGSRGIEAKAASRRRNVLNELLSRAERLMEKGIRTKALRKDDPNTYAALLIGMVRGLALSALTRGDSFAAADTAAIVRVFMKGAAR